MQTHEVYEQRSFLGGQGATWVVLVLVGLSVLVASWVSWQHRVLSQQRVQATQALEQKRQVVQQLAKTGQVAQKSRAQEVLGRAEAYRVEWSRVVGEILRQETGGVQFLNFSSGRDRRISVSGTAPSMEVIAKLLETLKSNPRIQNPFISEVSEAGKAKTKKKFGFSLTFDFAKEPSS